MIHDLFINQFGLVFNNVFWRELGVSLTSGSYEEGVGIIGRNVFRLPRLLWDMPLANFFVPGLWLLKAPAILSDLHFPQIVTSTLPICADDH